MTDAAPWRSARLRFGIDALLAPTVAVVLAALAPTLDREVLAAEASAATRAALVWQPQANPPAFACLNSATDIVRVTGRHESKYVTRDAPGRAFDARGAVFLIGQSSHGTVTSRGDASATGMCWAGGYFQSEKPWKASWDDHKDLKGPTRNSTVLDNASRGMTVTGLHFFNVHDGPRSTNALDWKVEHVWGEYVRDDCIENDHFATGEIRDSLFDGCYTGISTRPSSPADGRGHVVTIEKVLLRLQAMPFPYKWRSKGGSIDESGQPFDGKGIPFGHGQFF